MVLVVSAAAGAATRQPAVAGSFYSDDPKQLRFVVEQALKASPAARDARALVVPHAGYAFSGDVAGKAFAALDTEGLRRVILLGPSHHRAYGGGALPAKGVASFTTPLGEGRGDRFLGLDEFQTVLCERERLEKWRRHRGRVHG